MQLLIAIVCFAALGCYTLLFIWHLFWPEVDAVVEHVRLGAPILPRTPFKKKHRLICYSFCYNGKRFSSMRQGLLIANGFGPKLQLQHKFRVKVCPFYIRMSCPRRYIFETVVYLMVCSVALPTGLVYYSGKYGNWG